ncbi:MAG: hypothetical protein PQJ59_01660 [Spirochaetales bacterium]|nr:hypothetical protein [Spirochaetales bacterium]
MSQTGIDPQGTEILKVEMYPKDNDYLYRLFFGSKVFQGFTTIEEALNARLGLHTVKGNQEQS